MKKLLKLIIIILFVSSPFYAWALTSTPTDYSNNVTGRLATGITTTQTTGILVTADTYKTPAGTSPVTFPTGDMILKLSRVVGNNVIVEYIGVDSGTTQSNATVTLGTATRYLSSSDGTDFTSQGNGIKFPSGTIVELVWSAHHAENSTFKDALNTFRGSGAIISSQTSQAWIFPNSVTTAQRDAFTYGTSSPHIIFNSTKGLMQYYDGSNYIDFGSGGNVLAGYGNNGTVELATPTEILNATASGSSNAALVPAVKDIVTQGGQTGRIVALTGSGLFENSVLGEGSGSASGKILQAKANGEAKWASASDVITQNFSLLCVGLANTTATGASSTAEQPTGASCSIPANSLAAGDILKIDFSDKRTIASGDMDVWVKMNSTAAGGSSVKLGIFRNNNSVATGNASSYVLVTVRSIGSSGTVLAHGEMATNDAADDNALTDQDDSNTEPDVETVNTTLANTLEISVKFSASDGTHSYSVHNFIVSKFLAP